MPEMPPCAWIAGLTVSALVIAAMIDDLAHILKHVFGKNPEEEGGEKNV